MSRSKNGNKNRSEFAKGFAGIPRVVMDSSDYKNLSGGAVKLLIQLAYQYRGSNNGDLTVAYSVLKNEGFNSKDTITKSINKLIEANLIIRTRDGSFSGKGGYCALYALVWQPIDDLPQKKLNVSPTVTPPRKFSTGINRSTIPETGLEPSLKSGRCRSRGGDGRYLPS